MKKAICLLVSSFFLLTSCGSASGGGTSQDTSSNPSDSTTPSSESSSSSEPAKVLTGISAKFVDEANEKYDSLSLTYGVNLQNDYIFEVLALYDDSSSELLDSSAYQMSVDNETGYAKNPTSTGEYNFTFTYNTFEASLKATITDDEEFSIDLEHGKVSYGSYPQDYVSDADLITALNGIGGVAGAPVEYESNFYIKFQANPYSSSVKFHDEVSISGGAYYWFKFQPINWRILEAGDKYLLLAEQMLDAHCYYRDQNQRTIDGNTVTANNYEHSDIRDWLKNSFMPMAFGEKNKHIKETLVDNSAATTRSSTNAYVCNDTNDKIFLPSYADLLNTAYGFSSNKDAMNNDSGRVLNGSDFAKARGLMAGGNTEFNKGSYLTRSPYPDYGGKYMDYCQYNGALSFSGVNSSAMGVLPMMNVVLY